MLVTMQKVRENPIVNRFESIAQSYGVHGSYIEWHPNGLNEGGIYFVCGLDKSQTDIGNINIQKIFDNMKNCGGDIRTDVSAFKIDNQHPLMAHSCIVNYCQQLNTLKNVYEHFHEKIPEKMDPKIIEIMDVSWRHFANPEKPLNAKFAHEKTLRQAIDIVKKNLDPSSPEYKKYQYIANGYYDFGRGKLYNWAKMNFAKHKNEVTLSHLVNHAGNINFATINYASYPHVKAALEQRPNILYHFSEVRGNVLEVSGEDGYGSKEKNDRRYYTLHYPAVHTKEIEKILLELDYPKEFHRTPEEIDPHKYGIEYMVVPDDYFKMFRDLCDKHNIKICIDRSAQDTICGGIPVAFSAEHSVKTYEILKSSIKAFEKDIAPTISQEKNDWTDIKEPPLKVVDFFTDPAVER